MKKKLLDGPVIQGAEPGHRIAGYDLARGMAVLLMTILHFKGLFSVHDSAPLWLGQAIDFMDRRSAAALVMISGAGLTLFARAHGPDPGQKLFAGLFLRGLFLFLTGIGLTRIWSGDILHFYGVFIWIGIVLVRRSGPVLAGTALIVWLISLVRTAEGFEGIEAGLDNALADFWAELLFTGYFPVFPWAAYFIAGMGLGRLDMRRPVLFLGVMSAGFLLCAGAQAVEAMTGACWAIIDLAEPTPFSVVSGLGSGAVIISAGIALAAAGPRPWVRRLSSAGRSSLSFYVFHILILNLVCWVAGEGWASDLLVMTAGAMLFFWAYAAVAGQWLARWGRGPLEALMRTFPFIPVAQRLVPGTQS